MLVIHGVCFIVLKLSDLTWMNISPRLLSALQVPLTCVLHVRPQSLRAAVRVPAGALVPLGSEEGPLSSSLHGRCSLSSVRAVGPRASVLRSSWPQVAQFLAAWVSPQGSSQHGFPQGEGAKARVSVSRGK